MRRHLQDLGIMFLGIPTAFPSSRKEALKERLENQTLENLERENLTFLDEDQHPLELAGNFLKAESGVLLENGALGEGVCCMGSLATLVSGWDTFSGFSTAVCPKYILPKKTAENFQFKSTKSFDTLLEIPARSHLMDVKNADNFFSLDVC